MYLNRCPRFPFMVSPGRKHGDLAAPVEVDPGIEHPVGPGHDRVIGAHPRIPLEKLRGDPHPVIHQAVLLLIPGCDHSVAIGDGLMSEVASFEWSRQGRRSPGHPKIASHQRPGRNRAGTIACGLFIISSGVSGDSSPDTTAGDVRPGGDSRRPHGNTMRSDLVPVVKRGDRGDGNFQRRSPRPVGRSWARRTSGRCPGHRRRDV